MSRHTVELAGRIVAVVALLLILANATLVDRVPPTVQHISLGRTNGDDHVGLTHTTVDVDFSKAVDRQSAQAHFQLEPSVAGSYSWDGTTMIFTPSGKLPVSTQFTVSVSAGFRDTDGNVAGGSTTWTFMTIGLPTLTSSTPASGASDVPIDSAITLTFDRLMDVGSTQAAISIDPATRFRATWSGSTVRLTPASPLAFSTHYVVTVGADAADTDGNSPDTPIRVGFSTVTAGLAVVRVVPADGSAGASVDGPIAMFFDGPVDPGSVSGLLRVTPPAPGEVRVEAVPSDQVGAAPPASLVVYQPSASLAPQTTYTVQLLDGARSADNPGMVAAGRTWTFTTGAPSDSLQNQIVFLSSRTGIPNLWAMNPDGSNPRQLTDELAPVTAYDVTGDGKRIVYAAAGLVKTFRLGDASPTVLTPGDAWDYAPRILTDGTAVIVGRRGRADGQDEGTWELPIGTLAQPRQLVPGGAPPTGSDDPASVAGAGGGPGPWTLVDAVSSDGTVALLVAAQGALVSVDLASGATTPVGLYDPVAPIEWSDHERGFVVEATADGASAPAAWLVIPGRAPEPLGPGGTWLAVSPSGDLAWLAGSPVLHATVAVGGSPGAVAPGRPVTAATDVADRQPTFSPSGDLVLFARVDAASGASLGIWTVRTDGLELTQLSADGSDPRWLP